MKWVFIILGFSFIPDIIVGIETFGDDHSSAHNISMLLAVRGAVLALVFFGLAAVIDQFDNDSHLD